MKKFIALLILSITVLSLAFSFGCKQTEDLEVYCPDGAPALSLAKILYDDEVIETKDYGYDINIVSAQNIQTYVTGESPKADIAVLPVNQASKLLGSGETYTLIGGITHGNLYLLKKGNSLENITSQNVTTALIGKTVGVINIANVPGLTFKAILSDKGVSYNEIKDGNVAVADKVNLKGVEATEVVPNSDCDYFVVPEPALSTKIKMTADKPLPLTLAGNLQELYSQELKAYPQAVVVVKNTLLDKREKKVKEFISLLKENQDWIKSEETDISAIVSAIEEGLISDDMQRTFSTANLNTTVIKNCAINFVSAKDYKAEILAYIQKINALSNQAFGSLSDKFFYEG